MTTEGGNFWPISLCSSNLRSWPCGPRPTEMVYKSAELYRLHTRDRLGLTSQRSPNNAMAGVVYPWLGERDPEQIATNLI